MHEGTSLPVATVVLGSMELFAELGLVVLRDVNSLLELVSAMGEGALNLNIK